MPAGYVGYREGTSGDKGRVIGEIATAQAA
jgi:hypothetical protein